MQKKFHIELYSVLRDVMKNLWVIILAAAIGYMAVDVWNGSMYTPMYTSTSTLLVNLKNSATYSYTNLSSASEMAKIYTNVFVQPTMKAYAADHLGMNGFVGSVSSRVLENTNIFTVSVTSSSPEMSYKELCAVLEIYPQISESVFSEAVIEIMRAPNLPKAPSNSISAQNQRIAILACGLFSLAFVVLMSLFRDTVKDESSFRDNVDAKLFGIVGHERPHLSLKDKIFRKKASLLMDDAYASFRFTEHYHKLATKLEYLHRNNGMKIILVTSLAENEGKSTTAANMALALSSRGNRVALLDMDFKKPALHKVFQLQNTEFQDLATMLSGKSTFDEYRFSVYKNTGLSLGLNKKSYGNYVEWIYTERISEIFQSLRTSEQFDFVIIDTPPLSVAADVTGLVQYADNSLLVVRTDFAYTAAVNDAVLSLNENSSFIGCILNDVHREFTMLGQLGLDEAGYYGGRYHKDKYNYYSYHKYSEFQDTSET